MERDPAVYIVASGFHGTLYTGVTSNLLQRIYQHREGTLGGFTARYGCNRLVWFETGGSMEGAIRREKQLKNWTRAWKVALIEAANPTWRDLAEDLGFEPLVGKKVDPGSSPG
jgi:putative endonuclease